MALVLLVKSPEKLRRCDGTAIAIFNQISLKDSLKLTRDLLTDWRILLMLPCEFSSYLDTLSWAQILFFGRNGPT